MIKCMTCNDKMAKGRGCCGTCLNRHRKAVRNGIITWEELERENKVKPPLTRQEMHEMLYQRLGKHKWKKQ